jgi:hypothetical protein
MRQKTEHIPSSARTAVRCDRASILADRHNLMAEAEAKPNAQVATQYLNVPFRIRQSAKSSPRALGSKDQDLSIPRDVLMADCKLVVTRLTRSGCSPCLSLQNTHLRHKNNNIMLNGGSAGLLCILLQLRRFRRQTSICRPRRHSDSCRR